MFNLTLKNIKYKKTRSILTILGIVVAMQLYIVLSGIMNAYEKDLEKQVASMAGKVFIQAKAEKNSMMPMTNVLNENDAREILKLDGINADESTMIIYNELIPAQAPNMPPTIFVAGIEKGKEKVYFNDAELEGRNYNSNSNEVILGATGALWAKQEFNAELNDNIILKGEEFKIVGILPSLNASIDGSVIMPIESAQRIYSKQNLVNAIIVTVDKTNEVDRLAKKINKDYPNASAATSKEMRKAADEMLEGQRMFFAMINNTIVFVAIFMVMIIMFMAIHERKKEIGTLKAIGASFDKILFMVISECIILSVIGGLIALPISFFFTWLLIGSPSDLSIVFQYNDPNLWFSVFIITLIIGVASGIIPALTAKKVNPLESIRYE